MKKIYPLVFALVACLGVRAQHWGVSYVQHYRNINSVSILSPTRLIAVGGNQSDDSLQTLYESSNYGLWWNETGLDTIFTSWVTSAAFYDTLHGFGVGYLGKMVKTSDGGLNWSFVHSPINRNFNKIIFIDKLHAFIVGGWPDSTSTRTILKSTDGANTWNVVLDNQAGPWLRSVFFFDTITGFAVGDSGTILKTVDGGNTWNSIASPVDRNFYAISFASPDTGYIGGGYYDDTGYDSKRTLLRTVNGGASWTVVEDGIGPCLSDIFFLDAAHGYLVGDTSTYMTTTDAGFTWNPQTVTGTTPTTWYFKSVRFSDPQFGLIGSDNGAVYLYSNAQAPSVQTIGVNIIDSADVSMLAKIQTYGGYPANLYFYYSQDDPTLSNPFQTFPYTAYGNDSVSEGLTFLLRDTPYYMVAQGYNSGGVVNGDTLEFLIPSVMPVLTASAPANVNLLTATLQGSIDRALIPSTVYFEYSLNGDTPYTLVAPSPSYISDTGYHALSAIVSGLLPNQSGYRCRVKAVHGIETFYSAWQPFQSASSTGYISVMQPTSLTDTSVTLNGEVDDLPVPSTIWFRYQKIGDTSVTMVRGTPPTVADTFAHYDSVRLTGLAPNTIYQAYVEALLDSAVPIISNAVLFYTNPQTVVTGDSPTNVKFNSAVLNGTISKCPVGAKIFFDYWYPSASSIQVAATPAVVPDTLTHQVTAAVNNLLPDTNYIYDVVIVDSPISIISNPVQFLTSNPVILQAFAATSVTPVSATLNGIAGKLPLNSNIYFNYWTGTNTPVIVPATPSLISDTLTHSVSASVSGLLPYNTYNYEVVVEKLPSVSLNSAPFQFYTGGTHPLSIITLAASNLTTSSATLNGSAEYLVLPSSVYFDYWEPGQSRNSVAATPATISDTDFHAVSASVNLQANTTYWFQLKIVDSVGTHMGDSLTIYTGNSTIPNFDFENWFTASGERPVGWANFFGPATKQSPGYSGNYAVKLQSTTLGLDILSNGFIGDGGQGHGPAFYGGIPYHLRPDTFSGWFNYSMITGDTGGIIIAFKSQGQVISTNIMPITGNSGGNYQQIKVPVTYTSGNNPDTLFILLSPSNLNGFSPPGSWMIADDLSFVGAYPAIENGDFEQWQSFTYPAPAQWQYFDMADFGFYANADSQCVSQSTDAWHGHYSAQVTNFNFLGHLVGGQLSTLPPQFGTKSSLPSFPVNHKVQTFNGYYQFNPVNNDTLVAQCMVYSQGTQIGSGSFTTSQASTTYTPFTAYINYSDSTAIPDSATIWIQPYYITAQGLSSALVDYLNFDGIVPSGVNELTEKQLPDIKIYPNPANGHFTVEYVNPLEGKVMFKVSDMSGRTICENEATGQSGLFKQDFDLSAAASGIYLLTAVSGRDMLTRKLVIQH